MASYKVTDIVKDVRVALDSNDKATALLDENDVDTLKLDELIKSKILDAARFVLVRAKYYLLGAGKEVTENTITWNAETAKGNSCGIISLPVDFLRLVTFQMSDWFYPINELIMQNDPRYMQQHSRYAGVRGCPQRPVAALVSTADGQAIEFFSCSQGNAASVKTLRYIATPAITQDTSADSQADVLDFPDKLYEALKYTIAYLVAMTLEMPTANFYIETAKSYLE